MLHVYKTKHFLLQIILQASASKILHLVGVFSHGCMRGPLYWNDFNSPVAIYNQAKSYFKVSYFHFSQMMQSS